MTALAYAQPATTPEHRALVGEGCLGDALSVAEVTLPEATGVQVCRVQNRVFLVIDSKPYALSRKLAGDLAWGLCSQLEAMA